MSLISRIISESWDAQPTNRGDSIEWVDRVTVDGVEYELSWEQTVKCNEANEKYRRWCHLTDEAKHRDLDDAEAAELDTLDSRDWEYYEDGEACCDWDNPYSIINLETGDDLIN